MKSVLGASDVLRDIEFELVQGTVSRDALGRSIQAVRQYQNKVRGEMLDAARRAESREVITRLFQINEMLITLSQEMAAAIQSMQVDLRKVARIAQASSSAATPAAMPAIEKDIEVPDVLDLSAFDVLGEDSDWQPPGEVEDAMQPETLQVAMEVRPAGIPIIDGLLRRLRVALHSLVLFYVERLAKKQVAINQIYGEWILHLLSRCQYQHRQIELLSARVASFEAVLAKADEPSPSSTTTS